MIELHTWKTPNGRKISIALEEMGLPYQVFPVNINNGEQKLPDFLRLSPNGRIPAILDRDNGLALMESGAILLYLAEKTGQLMAPAQKWQVMQWLMWQMGGIGPMLGQVHHFVKYNPGKSPYAEERYTQEARRLYGVLDRQLAGQPFVAGDYSIADIAIWPWIARFQWQQIDLNDFPHVRRWYQTIAARPAVQAGYDVPAFGEQVPGV